jgi:hypothetical protein
VADLAAWLVGIGLNYVALASYAIRFFPPGAAPAELQGVDLADELRYYTATQVWVGVPLAIVVLALLQLRSRV